MLYYIYQHLLHSSYILWAINSVYIMEWITFPTTCLYILIVYTYGLHCLLCPFNIFMYCHHWLRLHSSSSASFCWWKLLIYHKGVIFFTNLSNGSRQKVAVSMGQKVEPYKVMIKLKLCKEWQKSKHWLCYAWWLEDRKKWNWEVVFCQSFKWRAKKMMIKEKHEHEEVSEAF